MKEYINKIEEYWDKKDSISLPSKDITSLIKTIFSDIEKGKISVCQKIDSNWHINEWIKKAILLHFKLSKSKIYDSTCIKWYDKISPQFSCEDEKKLQDSNIRVAPGGFIRSGAYIGKNSVIMPSFINVGAHVSSNVLIDSWSTIGSCAHIGKNCHISGGVGIGGVLEPLQAKPVIIEDNCFIGARSEIAEGVVVKEGAVISMGVFLGASTKIVNRKTGEITYGVIPPYSVVVPGTLPDKNPNLPSISCAVIIKEVDSKTRSKTSINELLRG